MGRVSDRISSSNLGGDREEANLSFSDRHALRQLARLGAMGQGLQREEAVVPHRAQKLDTGDPHFDRMARAVWELRAFALGFWIFT